MRFTMLLVLFVFLPGAIKAQDTLGHYYTVPDTVRVFVELHLFRNDTIRNKPIKHLAWWNEYSTPMQLSQLYQQLQCQQAFSKIDSSAGELHAVVRIPRSMYDFRASGYPVARIAQQDIITSAEIIGNVVITPGPAGYKVVINHLHAIIMNPRRQWHGRVGGTVDLEYGDGALNKHDKVSSVFVQSDGRLISDTFLRLFSFK